MIRIHLWTQWVWLMVFPCLWKCPVCILPPSESVLVRDCDRKSEGRKNAGHRREARTSCAVILSSFTLEAEAQQEITYSFKKKKEKSMPLKGHFHSRTPNLHALTPPLTSTYAHTCAPPDPLLLKIHIQYLRAHVYFKRHNFHSIYTHCPLLRTPETGKKTADPVLLWEVLDLRWLQPIIQQLHIELEHTRMHQMTW